MGLLQIKLFAVIKGLLRLWTLLCIAVPWLTRGINLPSVFLSPPHLLHVTTSRMTLFNSSNVIIQGGTFNSVQGGLHIHNRYSESGMYDFMSVLKRILIDDPMEDFILWGKEFLLEQFMTRPNASRRPIVTLILARLFERLYSTGSIAKVRYHLFSGFTDLQVPVRRRFFRRLQSFWAVHPNPMKILAAAFSSLEERKGVMKAIICFQQSHTNSLWKYLDYVNTSMILWN